MDAVTTSRGDAAERVSAFLWKVYAWMAIGLGLTAVVAFVTDDTTVAQVTFVHDPQDGWRLVTQQACSP
mgnify:CR=1 FL=1